MKIEKNDNFNNNNKIPVKSEKDQSHKNNDFNPGRRIFLKNMADIGKGAVIGGVLGGTVMELADYLNKQEPKDSKAVNAANIRTNGSEKGGGADVADKKNQNKTEKKEQSVNPEKILNIADHYLEAYKKLSLDPKKFPEKIFETELLIAQQCQESRGQIDAKSYSGARGVMQNMPVSIVDVTNYLNKLARNGVHDWQGPSELSKDEIREIQKLITTKSDYSRALGKIYLMQLWDNKYGYGVGRKEYANGRVRDAQVQLMGAYNAGHSFTKGKSLKEWARLRDKYRNVRSETGQRRYIVYKQAVEYVENIFDYCKRIKMIKKEFIENKVLFGGHDANFAAREIALKMDFLKDQKGKLDERASDKYLKNTIGILKQLNSSLGRVPSEEEIKRAVG